MDLNKIPLKFKIWKFPENPNWIDHNSWGFQLVLQKYNRGLWLDIGPVTIQIFWRSNNGLR